MIRWMLNRKDMTDDEIHMTITQIVDGRNIDGYEYQCCGIKFVGMEVFSAHLASCHSEEYFHKFKSLLRTEPVVLPSKERIHNAVNRHKKKLEKEAKQRANRRSHRRPEPKGGHLWLIYTPMGNKK